MNEDEIIKSAVTAASLQGYSGSYVFIGHGEVNNTYKIELKDGPVVLRIPKFSTTRLLMNEASALKQLNIEGVPKCIFFDEAKLIDGKQWIIETFVGGHSVERLSIKQFSAFGAILAKVHAVKEPTGKRVDAWAQLLKGSKEFGDEAYFLEHPDKRLKSLVKRANDYFMSCNHLFDEVTMSLIHADATPSNVLIDGDALSLIDWEFSTYSDPMQDFATGFYEDIVYNQGKWRIQITEPEKAALYEGYRSNGGVIDEARAAFWMIYDKLGAALFLYWRIQVVGRPVEPELMTQYETDFENLIASLETAI